MKANLLASELGQVFLKKVTDFLYMIELHTHLSLVTMSKHADYIGYLQSYIHMWFQHACLYIFIHKHLCIFLNAMSLQVVDDHGSP